ncbi:hypothetical protein BU17DRAFT_63752 [Hysterangium stoloniferum]|nr:hypothetical protein BU17DRAFT_63752 [Hysterangium stoloniferum]
MTSTTPHRLHCRPDIISKIFNCVGESTCLASALVCKAWLEPALDELWRVIDKPVALFKLLGPMHVTNQDSVYSWKYAAAILPSTWIRFDYYARRIRGFEYSEDGTSELRAMIDESVFVEIARTRPKFILLPRLQHLQWHSILLGYVMLFVHPQMPKLTVSMNRFSEDARSFEVVAIFLCECVPRLPNLVWLDLRASFSVANIQTQLLDMLRGLRQLTILLLPRYWITTSILTTVADLPRLMLLDWDNDWKGCVKDVEIVDFAAQDGSFPALRHISLETGFTCVTKLVENAILPARLTSLRIKAIYLIVPSALHNFLQLCATGYPALTSVDLDLFPNEPHPISSSFITLDTLRPLLTRPIIKEFTLVHPEQLCLTDSDLEEIAQRWPNLTKLVLACDPYIDSPPRLTISALVSLAAGCPELTHIALYLDPAAPSIHPLSWSSTLMPRLPNIANIDFGTSPISQGIAKHTAFFLSRLCSASSLYTSSPGQLELRLQVDSGHYWDDIFEESIPDDRRTRLNGYCEVWQMVQEDLPFLVASRTEESEWSRALEKELELLGVEK